MITKKDISKGAISNTHISKSAEIDPSKLKGDKVGSILIADKDGKYVPRKIRGDATLLPNGEFKVASTADAGEVTEQEVRNAGGIIGKDITTGSTLVGESDGTPRSVHVGTGANAIPQRDSSGNLKAETADQSTDSTKLNGQEASFYTDVSNHTGQTAAYEYTATSSSNVPQPANTFTHNLGYIPDVMVYESDGQTPPSFSEIDATVKSTTTTTDVTVSEGGVSMKVIIK